MTEKQQVSAADFLKAITSTSKLSGADILNSLLNSNGNIHMKADITDPLAYTAMHVSANWLDNNDYKSTAQIYRDIANFAEQFSVSKGGARAKMVSEAIVSVMIQEFEIEKAKSKMLMGK